MGGGTGRGTEEPQTVGAGSDEDGDATLCFVQGEGRAAEIVIAAANARRAQSASSER
jgi:hypothetical protein